MSSRKIEHCSTELIACLAEFELQLKANGIEFVRACTYRSSDEQALLYASGRTSPGKIITWAQAGKSLHNRTEYGKPASDAADYYPLVLGKLAGTETRQELDLWKKMGEIAEACGLEWGGRWPAKKRDRPHVQFNRRK